MAASSGSIADRMRAIADRLAARGDLQAASKAYLDAARAEALAKAGDGPSQEATWLSVLYGAPADGEAKAS